VLLTLELGYTSCQKGEDGDINNCQLKEDSVMSVTLRFLIHIGLFIDFLCGRFFFKYFMYTILLIHNVFTLYCITSTPQYVFMAWCLIKCSALPLHCFISFSN
jgi:hypothetical protein